ncbi:nucleoside phosphorylase domain-containing protein [Aspergillus varians]
MPEGGYIKATAPRPQLHRWSKMHGNHTFTVYDYTVGIICALYNELQTVRCLLDSTHAGLVLPDEDPNSYILGTMGSHAVLATCLPGNEYGTNAAASAASHLRRSFPRVKFCLLVGVAGGAPGKEDIRLGDVVVSLPMGVQSGVIQYDMGKYDRDDCFVRTGSLQRPPRFLLRAINAIRSAPNQSTSPLHVFMEIILQKIPTCRFPGRDRDLLFESTCVHDASISTCDSHLAFQVPRHCRQFDHPYIHYGLVGSGNAVIRNAAVRDYLAGQYNMLCFEMEAAGICNELPCLVIKGICDYSDSHKTKLWQGYAAAAAAAYAKLLLGVVGGSQVPNANRTWAQNQQVLDSNPKHRPFHITPAPDGSRRAEDILRKAQSYAERRRLWNPVPPDAIPLMRNFKEWAESRGSDVLVIEPEGLCAMPRAESFAFEATKFLKSRHQPVIWALWPEFDEPLTAREITRSLAYQVKSTPTGRSLIIPDDRIGLQDILLGICKILDQSFLVVQLKHPALALPLLQVLQTAFKTPRTLKVLWISYHPEESHVALSLPRAKIHRLRSPLSATKAKGPKARSWESIQPCL